MIDSHIINNKRINPMDNIIQHAENTSEQRRTPLPKNQAIRALLESISPVDFHSILNISSDTQISEKNYRIACVDKFLQIIEANHYAMTNRNGINYFYNGAFWNRMTDNDARHLLGLAALKMGVPASHSKDYIFRKSLLHQFEDISYRRSPDEGQSRVLINLQNGTFEFTENGGHIRDFRKDDFLTHQLSFSYDEVATAPVFHEYLKMVLPDEACRKVLGEYCAYIFTKNLKLEKCMFLYGPGANGKSVFHDIFNALVGKENICHYSLPSLTGNQGNNDYNRAMLQDKLVNYGTEFSGRIDPGFFKQLVSGEPIQARPIRKDPFIIENYARFIFNGNELPVTNDHSGGFYRRFMIIPFVVTIPDNEQDKELANKIINTELPGVFNWILEALNRLLNQKRFSPCALCDSFVEEYKIESDSAALFMREANYQPSSTKYLLLQDLYKHYRDFCAGDGYLAAGKKNFRKRIEKLGYQLHRMNVGMVVNAQIKTAESEKSEECEG